MGGEGARDLTSRRTPVNIVTRAQINGPVLHTPGKANKLVSSRCHATSRSNQNTVGRVALSFRALQEAIESRESRVVDGVYRLILSKKKRS